jgi:hypothetical protein
MREEFKLLKTLSEQQNDLREGESTTDCIFTIHQLIDYNLEANMLFIDYVKIFDRVIQAKSCHILK